MCVEPDCCLIVDKVEEIEARYPFKNLKQGWVGLYAPDNGVINVQQLLRSLLSLAKDYGAKAKQHTDVERIVPHPEDHSIWQVHVSTHDTPDVYSAKKIIIACGSYVNHVLTPSFGLSLDLDIWEMTACYFNANAGPKGTIFPSKFREVNHVRWLTTIPRHVVPICAQQGGS